MSEPIQDAVTGAFSFTGRYIARALLDAGRRIRTLSRRADAEGLFGDRIETAPLDFTDREGLTAGLAGAEVLYNTYWVRFERGSATFAGAIESSRALFEAAADAGVRRIVHVSVTHASPDSEFAYFRGKAEVERVLAETGVPYSIVRPSLIYGVEDILINNLAWILRRAPVFALPGRGDYPVQPIHAADVARIALAAALDEPGTTVDAAGPEILQFTDFVRIVAAAVGSRARIVPTCPGLAHLLSRPICWIAGDELLTREELRTLMAGVLTSDDPPRGTTRFGDWVTEHGPRLGVDYHSELARHHRG
jgi:NADH dehydrogenase